MEGNSYSDFVDIENVAEGLSLLHTIEHSLYPKKQKTRH